jgi:tungstate transport system substrate-binding protein
MTRIIFFLLLSIIANISIAQSIIIQSTTSTRDSGLYNYLLPNYPKYNDYTIKVVAVGTGQAIMNAKNCDGDILIVHDVKKEKEFMKNNFGIKRHNLMYNDFVVIGPKKDFANIKNSVDISEVFTKIYQKKINFISRSDSSGTHSAESNIWTKANIDPRKYSGQWYLQTGQGMGPSLNIAVSLNGYIFSDRSSWLRFNNKKSHKILYENPTELKNNYGMILVNPKRCKNIDYNVSNHLFEWLASDDAASLIKNYSINNSAVFYID